MYFRRYAQHEFAAGWLFNSLAGLGAGFNIVVNRLYKRYAKAAHGVRVKPDHIGNAEQVADKNIVSFVNINTAVFPL